MKRPSGWQGGTGFHLICHGTVGRLLKGCSLKHKRYVILLPGRFFLPRSAWFWIAIPVLVRVIRSGFLMPVTKVILPYFLNAAFLSLNALFYAA
jgi:hypothetical protein